MSPILAVLASWLLPISEHWQHLREHLLLDLLGNSFCLLLGTLSLTFIIGVGSAWFLSLYQVPGRRWLRPALILPLAIPAYVNGFINLGFWDYSGPFHTALRSIGIDGQIFEIRSLPGAAWILTVSLYPYVYLMSRQAFDSQGGRVIEAGRSLGMPINKIFWQLAVPMARPWIFGSLALVGMETLADFGTVSIFGVDTFTTAIYKSWFGFFSPETAAQLSSLLLAIVFFVFMMDYLSRKGQKFVSANGVRKAMPFRKRSHAYLVAAGLWGLFLVAFLLPVVQMLVWAVEEGFPSWANLLDISTNSFLVGAITAASVAISAVVLVFAQRFFPIGKVMLANRLAILGYALPGSVLAIGVFLPLVRLDNVAADFIEGLTGHDPGLMLTGGMVTMVVGLSIRFLAVGHTAIQSAQERISPRIDEAAINFGVYGSQQIRLIHLPLIWRAILGAMVLVFIDVIKEMPLTLMTRPFGWDTLSVKIFELISEGEWQAAALPSLILVLLGLIPVSLFKRETAS